MPSEQAMCYVDKESHNGKMSGDSVNAKPFTPSTSPNGVIDYSFASGRSSSYSSSNAASTVGAVDMEQLKASVLAAEAGTGEVAKVIQGACFTPRHNAFTTLLQLASKARQPEKAIEIFEAMQAHSGIAPNKFTYSALISAQARVGKWEQAEKYFNEMREKAKTDPTLLPNTVTYAALISGNGSLFLSRSEACITLQCIAFHICTFLFLCFLYRILLIVFLLSFVHSVACSI